MVKFNVASKPFRGNVRTPSACVASCQIDPQWIGDAAHRWKEMYKNMNKMKGETAIKQVTDGLHYTSLS